MQVSLDNCKFKHFDTNNPETDTIRHITFLFRIDRFQEDVDRRFGTGILLFGASVTKLTSEEDKNITKKLILQRNRHTTRERFVRFPNRVYFTWSRKDDQTGNEKHELNKLRQQYSTFLVMNSNNIGKLLRSSLVQLGCRGQAGTPLRSVYEERQQLTPNLVDSNDDVDSDVDSVLV